MGPTNGSTWRCDHESASRHRCGHKHRDADDRPLVHAGTHDRVLCNQCTNATEPICGHWQRAGSELRDYETARRVAYLRTTICLLSQPSLAFETGCYHWSSMGAVHSCDAPLSNQYQRMWRCRHTSHTRGGSVERCQAGFRAEGCRVYDEAAAAAMAIGRKMER